MYHKILPLGSNSLLYTEVNKWLTGWLTDCTDLMLVFWPALPCFLPRKVTFAYHVDLRWNFDSFHTDTHQSSLYLPPACCIFPCSFGTWFSSQPPHSHHSAHNSLQSDFDYVLNSGSRHSFYSTRVFYSRLKSQQRHKRNVHRELNKHTDYLSK